MSIESIRRELWLGEIATCFTLDAEDLSSIVNEPEPCCLMLPRSSYLPLHISEVKAHFTQYIKPSLKDSEIWFETENGDKIRWHLPVGVSYDMHERGGGGNAVWQLTVHFSFYPEQVLLRCPSIDCVKAHFMSTIKEADSLKHASGVMNNIRESENAMLWNGILTRSFDEFWTINRRLMDCNTSKQPLQYKHLAMRIYKTDKTYIQPFLSAPTEDDNSTDITLGELLTLYSIDMDSGQTILCQGIDIPLDSNVYELSQTMSYPDNFLYLCVVQQRQNASV